MSRRRKIALAACATLAVIPLLFWLRPKGLTYEGRTVREWFRRYDELSNKSYYDAVRGVPVSQRRPVTPTELTLVESAFKGMGTNAVPYLASRITRDHSYSRTELWRIKIRWRLPQLLKGFLPLPTSKGGEAASAANLLVSQIKPPGEMLLPLIEPALQSTNEGQHLHALLALRGISSGHGLARPYLERGLKDPDSQVQRLTADAIRWFGPHGKWAVTNLVELARSPDLMTHESALHALNILGTNSWPVVPKLKEMLAEEKDLQRQKIIAHAIEYISESGPSAAPKKE